jgi:beta-lactamase regulating signal transducer with metallopeptidase domain
MIPQALAGDVSAWPKEVVGFFTSQVVFSAILFVLVAGLARLFSRRSARLTLGLWSLVFVRLLLPSDFSAPFSGRMLIERAFGTRGPELRQLAPTDPEAEGRGSAASGRRSGPTSDFGPIHGLLFAAWLSGLAAVGTVYSIRMRRYRLLVRNAEMCRDDGLLALVDRWKRLFKVRRPVRLVFGSARVSPFTMGLFRPVIYIPKCFLRKDLSDAIEPAIAHEMAHIRFGDDFWVRLQNVVQLVYFFNPVAWLAGRQLHQEREAVCDAAVLSKQALTRKRYGTGLLNVIRIRLAPSDDMVPLPSFASEKTRLIRRLQNIKRPDLRGRSDWMPSFLLIALFGSFVLPMARASRGTGLRETGFIPPMASGILVLEQGRDWDGSLKAYYDHKGVDIVSGQKPSLVSASAAGKVVSTGTDEIFTAYREVTLEHAQGFRTRYLHLDSLCVRPGQAVKQGQALGRTPFCVHFEVLKNGRVEDPESYVTLPKRLTRKIRKE